MGRQIQFGTGLFGVGAIGGPSDRDQSGARYKVQIEQSGDLLKAGEEGQRGDLAFWRGHVGILLGDGRLLHANAYHMQVVAEEFAIARQRLAAQGLKVLCFRRLG